MNGLSLKSQADSTQVFIFAVGAIGGIALLVVLVLVSIILYRKFRKWRLAKRSAELDAQPEVVADAAGGKQTTKAKKGAKKKKAKSRLDADVSSDDEEVAVTLDQQKKARERKMSVHDIEILQPGDNGDWTLLVEQDAEAMEDDDATNRGGKDLQGTDGFRFDDAYDNTAALMFKGGFAISMPSKSDADVEFDDAAGGASIMSTMVQPFADRPSVVDADRLVDDHAYALTTLRKKSFVSTAHKQTNPQTQTGFWKEVESEEDLDFDWKEDVLQHAVVHVAAPAALESTFSVNHLKRAMEADDDAPQDEPGRLLVVKEADLSSPEAAKDAPPAHDADDDVLLSPREQQMPALTTAAIGLTSLQSPGDLTFATPRTSAVPLGYRGRRGAPSAQTGAAASRPQAPPVDADDDVLLSPREQQMPTLTTAAIGFTSLQSPGDLTFATPRIAAAPLNHPSAQEWHLSTPRDDHHSGIALAELQPAAQRVLHSPAFAEVEGPPYLSSPQRQADKLWSPPPSAPHVDHGDISLAPSRPSTASSTEMLPPVAPPLDLHDGGYAELTRRQSVAIMAEKMLRFADRVQNDAQQPPRPNTTAPSAATTFVTVEEQKQRIRTADASKPVASSAGQPPRRGSNFFADEEESSFQAQSTVKDDDEEDDILFDLDD